MAKPATASQTRTASAQSPAPKTAAVETPAEKPKVALVADAPPAEPKRRGRPPAAKRGAAASRKAKTARKEILFLVETEEESGKFEAQKVATVTELLDLMDENRKVLATREWREF